MRRSLLFALTGTLWLGSWVAGPSYEMPEPIERWRSVLLFSAALLALAVALPVLGRIVGGSLVVRLATFAGAVAGVASVTNVFEDGLQIDWFFFVFVVCLLLLDGALLALTLVIARMAPHRYRLLAVVPAGTVASILIPVAIGPTMLITWLVAAVAALRLPVPNTPVPAAPTPT